jgi:hypothetical protein
MELLNIRSQDDVLGENIVSILEPDAVLPGQFEIREKASRTSASPIPRTTKSSFEQSISPRQDRPPAHLHPAGT